MAAHVTTYLRFDTPIDRASAEIEGRATRFRWVDVADTLIGVEPSVDLGAEEKLVIRVRYKDGASPATATLTLVTHPSVVDKEMLVVRRARTREALEAKLAETEASCAAFKAQYMDDGLPHLAFTGLLDSSIKTKSFDGRAAPGYRGGLKPERGTGYRATRWAMVAIRVHNLPGRAPWMLGSARLTSVTGNRVQVHSVYMEKPQLAPGEAALVVVMLEPPSADDRLFQLVLVDTSGGLHPIDDVEL